MSEKYQQIKEEAQTSLQEEFSAKKKLIHVNIDSPILLLPINPSTELWAINLGNFVLKTQDSDIALYDKFCFEILHCSMRFYPSIEVWTQTVMNP